MAKPDRDDEELEFQGSAEQLTSNGSTRSFGSDAVTLDSDGTETSGEKEVDKYGFTGGAQQYRGLQ